MSFDRDKLFRLLPAIHRLRDANGMGTLATNPTPKSLEQLIAIVADQVAVLEEELEQLHDDQFVETAAPWALPYLGELLGLRGLDAAGRDARFAPRAEVANTIAYRRRKGTSAMLEQLARDVTGQPAAVVEFWKRLAATQHVNHVRRGNVAWASVRNARQLEFVGTPFEAATRTAEVRRIERELGKWNIPNVGLFVWRLRAFARTRSPLVESHLGDRRLRLHPLGLDVPLCARPETETEIAHLAEPENVPVLLTWRRFAGKLVEGTTNQFHPDEKWYGPNRSVQLWRLADGKWQEIPGEEIVVGNLHDVVETGAIARWGHDTAMFAGKKKILLDPLRGRVVLPVAEKIFATYCTLFPADLGGGEYARAASFDKSSSPKRLVTRQPAESDPANPLATTIQAALDPGTAGSVLIQISDGDFYHESLTELSAKGVAVELRAADGRWPTLMLDQVWKLSGDAGGSITLNGLLLSGQNLAVAEGLHTLRLRHCTLLPGLNIGADGRVPENYALPSALEVPSGGTVIELENCIVGPLWVGPDVNVRLRNCIVDAGSENWWALRGPDAGTPGGTWRMENCTIIGRVAACGLELASNTIFHSASVTVERRQEGCVRFCWLPDGAVVPRQHKCVPRVEADDQGNKVPVDFRPQFVSLRFGDATYCQLSRSCAGAIRRGADDESEMGVYHDLLEPRREAHLRARLRDYLRFGLEAGIFYEQQTPRVNAA
ncbi:MAG: hypothetical protein EPO07_00315 [Verrucomicrobia bacterium]|nr:MAG: hypothetical protein EPO07_00315 [Verrucomicrobiota bacterium]